MAKLSLLKEISRHDPLNLPAVVWIIIGLFVTIVSMRLGEKFTLFMWVGLLFLAFGVFKLLAYFITKKEVSNPEQNTMQQAMGGQVIKCNSCRKSVYMNQYFCHHCGGRLR